jgi:hypothetical protein
VDLWTSPNYLAILRVISHYISESRDLEQAVLSLLKLDGLHSRANMAGCVLKIIKDYGIASKVGYFMMDNAESNDTMMVAIAEELQEQYTLDWDPVQHRLRCNGHIINLTAQAFLFCTLEEALDEDQNPESVYAVPTEVEMDVWRQKGPLGRLHNIIVHIQRSVQRQAEFQQLSNGLNLARDNSTRWNSWYTMLKSAMRPKAQSALRKYCGQHETDIRADCLLSADWEDLSNVQSFLRYFFDATKTTEGRTATIERILPAMDFLLEKFEEGKELYKENPFIGPCINSGWERLEKYYNLTDRSPVYIAAMVLCPAIKWGYFQKNWERVQFAPAQAKGLALWKAEYQPTAVVLLPVSNEELEEDDEELNTFTAWEKAHTATQIPDLQDEYEKYIAAPIMTGIKDARKWWLESTQQLMYPNLSIMALDLLSIPAMSAEPECLFSGAKVTITDRRNKLGIQMIQAIESLKSWLGSRVLASWGRETV